MAEVLSDYLKDMAATPFQYGENDCASFIVGWFDRVAGKTALSAWRGRYSDGLSCEQYISRHGGFAAIAQGFLGDHFGAARCAPKPGNAVLALFKTTKAMGLRVDASRVALRTHNGLIITKRVEVIDEWGLP